MHSYEPLSLTEASLAPSGSRGGLSTGTLSSPNELDDSMTDTVQPVRLFPKPRVTFALDDDVEGGTPSVQAPRGMTVLSNNLQVPITRPPTKPRDSLFAFAFFAHFVVVGLLGLFEGERSMESAVFDYSNAGSWSSMIMIVILLGSFCGIAACFVIAYYDARETILSIGILLSITLQACLGNVLLILKSRYSFLGIFVLVSAMIDSLSYKKAKDGISFTSALIQMVIDIFKGYGVSLVLACGGILIAQTFLLLWWGAFFVDLISSISSTYAEYLVLFMAFSLFWIANFFHAFVSYLVGGCVLWHFVKQADEGLAPGKRVLLHLHCGFTSGLGSICKGALFCPLSQRVLSVHNWARDARFSSHSLSNQFRNVVLSAVFPLVKYARRYHRLTFCLTATYGRTLRKAAEEQMEAHPETVDLSVEDNTHFTLAATATELAGLISITFGVVAERREGPSWPLFFFVCFCLAYCGLSLAVHTFNSAIDALIVAFAAQPQRFAQENQIVFLRWVRSSEASLR